MADIHLGIDIGTGSTKVVGINKQGMILSSHQVHYSPVQGDYSQIDPEIIWGAFLEVINQTKETNAEISSVSLSSCMHSLLLVDKENKPLTPLITWADSRSESIAKELRSEPFAEQLYKESGTPIHAMSPLCKIAWFKSNERELFHLAYKFIGIKEFIWFRLFNLYQIDYSIASATGLWNMNTNTWNPLSLEIAGITETNLSAIVPCSHSLIYNNQHLHLQFDHGVTFYIGSSDGCLANIGSFVLTPNLAAITIGTSGAVRTTLNKPYSDYKNMLFNYFIDDQTVISGGPVNNGGNVIQWLLKTYLKIDSPSEDDYKDFFNAVKAIPPGSEGLIFLPYLNGERAPIWNEQASASFIGIKNYHTNQHFLNAALEGICYALNQIIIQLHHNQPISDIHASGGFTTSTLWLQMLADISGKRILLFYKEDASALGAAFFSLKSSNLIANYNSLKNEPLQIFIPNDAKHIHYKKYQNIFNKLYSTLHDINILLNKVES